MSKTPLFQVSPRLGIAIGLAVSLPAVLSAQTTLYWGGGTIDNPETSVDVSSTSFQSPYNGGSWNNTLLNWNSSTSATTGWQAWEAGALAVIKSNKPAGAASSTITLTEDVTVGGISLEYTTTNQVNQGYTIGGTGTITLNEGSVISNNSTTGNSTLSFGNLAVLAGSHGFTSNGFVTVNSASTVSGNVTIAARTFSLGSTGSLLNIDSFNVATGARFDFTNAATGSGSDTFKNTATVTLRHSALYFTTSGSGTSETLGKIALQGSGFVNVGSGRTLTLANGLDRGSNGKGVLTTSIGNVATNFGSGTNIVLGNTAASTLLPYAINVSGATNNVRFLSVDGSGVLQAVTTQAADKNLSTWTYNDPSANVQLIATVDPTASDPSGAITGAFARDITVGTVALGATLGLGGNNTQSNNVTLDFGGNLLTTQAVAAAINVDRGVNYRVGLSANDRITSSTGELYLIHDRNNNAALIGNFYLNAAVVDSGSTSVDLILGGATGQFELHRANTHTGKTYINARTVTLGANGSLLKTSELNISSGSTFAASGATNANNTWGGGSVVQKLSGGGTYSAGARTVTIGANGTLAPGSFSAGETLNFTFTSGGKLTFVSGSSVALTLGTLSDSIAFTTTGDWLSGTFKLDLTSGEGFQSGVAYSIFKNVTTTGVTPSSVWLNGAQLTGSDYTWDLVGNTYNFTYTGLIPEPSSAALLLGLGGLGFAALRRRRR